MNLIQQLSEAYPRWRQEISANPIEAAIELGILDEDPADSVPELDFSRPTFGDYEEPEDE